jgi:hypothetical protein
MKLDMITRMLNRAAKEGSLVEIYLDAKNPNHFIVGEIQGSCVAGVAVFITFSADGEAQNIHVAKIAKIIKVKTHTKYLIRLAKLAKNLGRLNPNNSNTQKVGKHNVGKTLKDAKRNSEIITVQVGKVGVDPYNLTGFVLGLDDNYFQMKVLNDLGEDDGFVVCRRKQIDSIELGSKHQRKLKILGAA